MGKAISDGGIYGDIGHCRLCGQAMVHYRKYGYRCSNPDHAQIVSDISKSNNFDPDKISKSIVEWRKKHGY